MTIVMRSTAKRLFVLPVLFLFWSSISVAQDASTTKPKLPEPLTGKYEGVGKGPNGDVQMTLDLVYEAGKFAGRVTTPNGIYEVIKGQIIDGLMTLELQDKDSVAKLSLRPTENKLVGELSAHGRTGLVEFKRVSKDEITGEWDAAADAQGQAFPFTLTLKVEGEKVTGSSNSELGNTSISSGFWKDGKLVIVLEMRSGQIGLIATLQDGKLIGDYDFAGQMQGKWVAVKKK